jgi:hypothetical protein
MSFTNVDCICFIATSNRVIIPRPATARWATLSRPRVEEFGVAAGGCDARSYATSLLKYTTENTEIDTMSEFAN